MNYCIQLPARGEVPSGRFPLPLLLENLVVFLKFARLDGQRSSTAQLEREDPQGRRCNHLPANDLQSLSYHLA
jgi:hypothetical protein